MQNQSVYTPEEASPIPELTKQEERKMVVGQCNYLLLMILSLAAFILSQNATIDCNFAQRTAKFYGGFSVDDACAQASLTSVEEPACKTFLGDHGVGYYSWMGIIPVNQQVCLSYTMFVPEIGWVTPSFDATFHAGKVFGILANIFGAVGWLSVIFATCCPVSQERVKGMSCYFTFACICQSFTFLIYGSNVCNKGFFQQYFPTIDINNAIESVTCSLGSGANRSIAAAVLYAVCSGLALFSIAPAPVGYHQDKATNNEEEPTITTQIAEAGTLAEEP